MLKELVRIREMAAKIQDAAIRIDKKCLETPDISSYIDEIITLSGKIFYSSAELSDGSPALRAQRKC